MVRLLRFLRRSREVLRKLSDAMQVPAPSPNFIGKIHCCRSAVLDQLSCEVQRFRNSEAIFVGWAGLEPATNGL